MSAWVNRKSPPTCTCTWTPASACMAAQTVNLLHTPPSTAIRGNAVSCRRKHESVSILHQHLGVHPMCRWVLTSLHSNFKCPGAGELAGRRNNRKASYCGQARSMEVDPLPRLEAKALIILHHATFFDNCRPVCKEHVTVRKCKHKTRTGSDSFFGRTTRRFNLLTEGVICCTSWI